MPSFRAAAAAYLEKRFAVRCDPATEVVSLIGSKEGIANMAVAFVDPATSCSCPTRATRSTASAPRSTAATVYPMPLRAENGFLPDLKAIPEEIAQAREAHVDRLPQQPDRRPRHAPVLRRRRRLRRAQQHHRRPRQRLRRDLLRRAAAELPRHAGRARARHRVPLALEDLQHDGLARRLRRRQPRARRGPRQGQDQRRLRHLPGGAGGRRSRRSRATKRPSLACARSTASGAT